MRVKSRTGQHAADNRLHATCTCSNEVDGTPHPTCSEHLRKAVYCHKDHLAQDTRNIYYLLLQTLASVLENL